MAHTKIYKEAQARLITSCPYTMSFYLEWDYSILKQIRTVKRASKRGDATTYNDVIIMGDTETSKDHLPKNKKDICENHVCAWTISIRAYEYNIVTLWGKKPNDFVECVSFILNELEGEKTVLYFHNLGYDWTFLRRFIMAEFGTPKGQLNIKPYYPVYIEFKNGLIIKDSLILAQRKLEKWAEDLDVEHKKAVGKWDYNKIRHQKRSHFTPEELEYIEHDTLAGVECIDATMKALNNRIYSIPYTNTGIVRNETRKRGKKNRARQYFNRVVPDWESQMISEMLFHGGFTHGNRYIINWVNPGECRDFASEYPAKILLEKFPAERFAKYEKEISINKVLEMADKYAMKFLFSAKNIRLKDKKYPMPMVQAYKCIHKENPVIDNGRIISADYISIWWTEYDLNLFNQLYDYDVCWITNLQYALKDYLPRWFTDLVYELFRDKTQLKGGDPVLYALKKAMLNACFGMSVQKPVKVTINEDYVTGEYKEDEAFDPEKEYDKYVKNFNSILPYDWGCWITSMAQADLFELSTCIAPDGIWLYSDTDSIYATKWDDDKLEAYNQKQRDKLINRGYEPIEYNGKLYYPGVAEFDGVYSEVKVAGAKRYCCRYADDPRNKESDRGKLKLTVAGVPKKGGAKCLKDDINNFRPGMIFDGETTGKTQHTHFYNEIHEDSHGNLIGDSIDLSPCDYLLDDIFNNAKRMQDWADPDYQEEVLIQVFEEDD